MVLMTAMPNANRLKRLFLIVPLLVAGVLIAVWMLYSPPGFMGKLDAIGYSVCHQIPDRTFAFDGEHMPLCSRCTGMHLGALFGLVYHLRHRKFGGMPSKKAMVLLGLFLLAFAIDGLNSFIGLSGFIPQVYESQNWLRLLTGTFLGFALAAILVPIFNQTMWRDWSGHSALRTWKQLGFIVIINGLIILLVLSGNSTVLYALSVISIANVIIILTMIHTILWVMVLKRENQFDNFSQIKTYMLYGFITVMLQIAAMDYLRYTMSGTWGSLY